MTPILNVAAGSPEERYNTAQTSIRSLIERCNGVLKNRFRCLLKHRVLHYSPERASRIINACVVLHNIRIRNKVQLILEDNEENMPDNADPLGLINVGALNEARQRIGNPDLAAGVRMRQHIVENYF